MNNNQVENKPMTEDQIANWRKILFGQYGGYALIMPKEEIQKFRDNMQSKFS